jgi:hypothetical protein
VSEIHDPSQPPPDAWDDEVAADLLGKTVLIGLTYQSPDDVIMRREQVYGFVTSADRKRGIALELDGQRLGETYVLPPTTSAFQRAPLGDYRLSTTGEVVSDPSYTASFTIVGRADG